LVPTLGAGGNQRSIQLANVTTSACSVGRQIWQNHASRYEPCSRCSVGTPAGGSLITAIPEEGCALARAPHTIHNLLPDLDIPKAGRPNSTDPAVWSLPAGGGHRVSDYAE